jgi:endogenous inhibitor of DNA gyrase (YacG/DUF329 family)
MKRRKHPDHVQYPHCPVCGTPIMFNKRRTNVYCSKACKQAAWRQAHGLVAGDKAEHYRKIIETKRSQEVNVTCQWCDRQFTVDQTRARTMYCSAACKQAAWRHKKAEQAAYEAQLAKTAKLDSWDDLPSVLREMERLYFAKHGYNWTLCEATIRPDGRSCYLDTRDGEAIYFQDRERARRFLAGYVANGRPNYAALRQK